MHSERCNVCASGPNICTAYTAGLTAEDLCGLHWCLQMLVPISILLDWACPDRHCDISCNNCFHQAAVMQNTTVWRARLKAKDLPGETHVFMGGGLVALSYPIGSQGQTVWTVSASEAHLKKTGLSVQHGLSRSQGSSQSPAQHANTSEQEQATRVQSDVVSAKEASDGLFTLMQF